MFTDVVLVLSLFESNRTFETLFGLINSSSFDWVVILQHSEVLNGRHVTTVMEGLDATNSLAGVLAQAVR